MIPACALSWCCESEFHLSLIAPVNRPPFRAGAGWLYVCKVMLPAQFWAVSFPLGHWGSWRRVVEPQEEKALRHLRCLTELLPLLGHACHPSVLWQGDVHLTGLSFEDNILLSERLQPLPVGKYFPGVFGTELTSSLCLGRVQGTETRAAPCCREVPCGGC